MFKGVNLKGTGFTDAFLYHIRVEGADLRDAKGLTQAQLDETCGDTTTGIPAGLSKPVRWRCAED